jgi:hypothetical protein
MPRVCNVSPVVKEFTESPPTRPSESPLHVISSTCEERAFDSRELEVRRRTSSSTSDLFTALLSLSLQTVSWLQEMELEVSLRVLQLGIGETRFWQTGDGVIPGCSSDAP